MSIDREISRIARAAGGLVMSRLGDGSAVAAKGGMELLTRADLQSQEFIRGELGELLPGVAFVGEEGGGVPVPPCWVVDPLDGTTNFAHGFPFFAVSIALADEDGIAAGCVHDPVRRETFTASRRAGAFLDGVRIATGTAACLHDALLATGFPYRRRPGCLGFDTAPLLYFLERARGIRRTGSAALDLCYTAAGRLDGFWEEHLRPWDMAAGSLIAAEAGALVLGWDLEPWTLASGGVVACAPTLAAEFLDGIGTREGGAGGAPPADAGR
jgi:myo-inositol-1(or 4)-monophosphatase